MFVSPRVDGDYGIIFLFLGRGGGDLGIMVSLCGLTSLKGNIVCP